MNSQSVRGVCVLGCLLLAMALSSHLQAAIFTVTTVADTDDPGDGLTSLREAINAANANPGLDTVDFNIGGPPPHTILVGVPLGFPLPHIVDPVILDATTQQGYVAGTPAVVLDGTNVVFANPYLNGLQLEGFSDTSEVRGLGIRDFPGIGISLYVSDTTIEANSIEGNGAGDNYSVGGILISYEKFNHILNNVISGNYGHGIEIAGPDYPLGENLIQGNVIVENTGDGINIWSPSNRIFDNVISSNDADGIFLWTFWAQDNIVLGNFIGTDQNGAVLGNGQHGIEIQGGNRSEIGGVDSRRLGPAANVIAHNEGDGVYVYGGSSAQGNTIRGNSIFDNGGLGIDLDPDGVTENDDQPCKTDRGLQQDCDTGPNGLQNFPRLIFAMGNGNSTTVRIKFSGELGHTFKFDFYVNDQVDPSGNGEGKTYLATHTLTVPTLVHTIIADLTLPSVPFGKFITATATDDYSSGGSGNTSEFSNAAEVKGRSQDRR